MLLAMIEAPKQEKQEKVASPGAAPVSVDALYPELYRELKRVARARLAGGGRNTLMDTSVLVHEAFLRMQQARGLVLNDSSHFMAYAATTMRSVIIDFVRRRNAERRGGKVEVVTIDTEAAEDLGADDDEIVAVHEALEVLKDVDPKLVQLVEMRYFAGMTESEVAAALGVTERTVRRYWERARLMLAEILRK
jgi:RNA polymerase sigma factor (TIGR02999 family)